MESSIEMIFEKNERKKIKINEIPVKKIGGLMGHLNAVIFSPEDLFIIKEGPSERRRFLDITLSQLKPSYFYDLQQYSKILLQRNILLKEMVNKKELFDTLEIWNNHLIKTGSRIMKARNEFIKRMGYAEIHVFPYSRRQHTKADLMEGHLPEEVKAERARKLIALGDQMSLDYRKAFKDQEFSVITEAQKDGLWHAHTTNYIEVAFKAEGIRENDVVIVKLSLPDYPISKATFIRKE
jgi:DNA replication and repair protein RecF